MAGGDPPSCRGGVLGLVDLDIGRLEAGPQEIAEVRVVVDHEHPDGLVGLAEPGQQRHAVPLEGDSSMDKSDDPA
jgi:hypothetical protein